MDLVEAQSIAEPLLDRYHEACQLDQPEACQLALAALTALVEGLSARKRRRLHKWIGTYINNFWCDWR